MKDIETSVAVKYYKHKNNNEPQKRRQEDITRDYSISVYKAELANKQFTINGYMTIISKLFNYITQMLGKFLQNLVFMI